MNFKVCTTLAVMAAALDVTVGTFVFGTTTAVAGSSVALSGGSAAALGLLGGVVLLKGLVLGAALLSSRSRGGRRGRREAESDESVFFAIQASEPDHCYKRLICDMATGTFPKSENDIIMDLFNQDAPIQSAKFEYVSAAKVGKITKNIQTCEIRYSCPLTTQDMAKLFA